jgi:Ca2+-binding RTX toxin-like protein
LDSFRSGWGFPYGGSPIVSAVTLYVVLSVRRSTRREDELAGDDSELLREQQERLATVKRATLLMATMMLGLLLAAGMALADTTIDTTPRWDGEMNVYSFGYPTSATYGQVLTAPANDTQLDSFTFLMDVPDTATFRGEVYAWDGKKATGPNLYESAPRTTSGSGDFEEITFDTGGVQLTGGQKYVLFATISKDYEASSGQTEDGYWGFILSGDAYAGGEFVYKNNGSNFNALLIYPWNRRYAFGDLAFKAVFSNPSQSCTITGTKGSDFLRGTMSRDVICAKGGSDVVEGRGGNDVLWGGPGGDAVEGGAGADELYGQKGSDSLRTEDGVRGNDAMDGGGDTDACGGDRGDTKKGCEASLLSR